MVKADGARSRGRGFESRHHILDGCKHYINTKITKSKDSRMGPKKIYKKKTFLNHLGSNKDYLDFRSSESPSFKIQLKSLNVITLGLR